MPIRRKVIIGTSTRNLLRKHENDELTYNNIGMSLTPAGTPTPEGRWHTFEDSRVVGHGRDAFVAVGYALMHWQLNENAGFFVQSKGGVVREGESVGIGLPIWFMGVTAVCRVVRVVSEADRIGFAYGTLPGHPETGEESFIVELKADGSVVMNIRAISRPAALFTKLAGPFGTRVQRRAAKRYLDAAQRIGEAADKTTKA